MLNFLRRGFSAFPSRIMEFGSPHNTSSNLHFLRNKTSSIHGRLFYRRRPKEIPFHERRNYRKRHLEGAPQKKGICFKVRVESPKKPNSGLRKVARVRLSSGKKVKVYIPGIGHNLNVHSVILVRGGVTKDLHACYFRAVRGVYDLLPVKNRFRARAKYGVKLPSATRERRIFKKNKRWLPIEDDLKRFNESKWMIAKNEDGKPLGLPAPLTSLSELPKPTMFNIVNRLHKHWYKK